MSGRGIEAACWASATRDSEVRQSKAGNAFAVLNLMVSDGGTDADGKPVSTFIKALAFGQHVETARKIRRGDRVYLEGQLTASIWRPTIGEPRLDLTIKAFRLEKTGIGRSRPPRALRDPRHDPQAPIEDARTVTAAVAFDLDRDDA
jgi:single-stranded DNA-binding protein